jgi:hypothetical protein
MSPASNTSGAPLPSVAILGVDALLAARPATPVQLAHACQAAGYAAVYPVTWGDELLAAACMRRVAARGDDPAIFCACPHVSDALLEVGTDLARFLVPLVAPPVACARYLRALYGYNRVRITYIGACPGAHDPAIDATLTPVQFFGVLAQLGITLPEQPEVFDSVLPPDRRRHRSVPGGAPTSEMLTIDGGTRTLQEIIDDEWKTELAQRLLLRHRAVFDVAPALGCHCAGARPGVAPDAARPSVIALEPPRASTDVIDANVAVDVDRTLPFILSRVREVVPAPVMPSQPDEQLATAIPAATEPPLPTQPITPEEIPLPEADAPRRKAAAPVVARAAQTVPLARTEGGQVLPRAYAARRRTPSEGGATIASPASPQQHERVVEAPLAVEVLSEMATSEPVEATSAMESAPPSEPSPTPDSSEVPERPPLSTRPTPRSATVPIPSEELRPVPPSPAANHVRAAIVTAVATVALALVAFVAFRRDDGRVTVESSGIAAPASGVLDSLPPLPFPLPDTRPSQELTTDSTTAPPPSLTTEVQRPPQQETARVSKVAPRDNRRPLPSRTRRRTTATRRTRADSSAPSDASQRTADSMEREAIRRELEHRRARLDSIARSLEPDPSRPDR